MSRNTRTIKRIKRVFSENADRSLTFNEILIKLSEQTQLSYPFRKYKNSPTTCELRNFLSKNKDFKCVDNEGKTISYSVNGYATNYRTTRWELSELNE